MSFSFIPLPFRMYKSGCEITGLEDGGVMRTISGGSGNDKFSMYIKVCVYD